MATSAYSLHTVVSVLPAVLGRAQTRCRRLLIDPLDDLQGAVEHKKKALILAQYLEHKAMALRNPDRLPRLVTSICLDCYS